MKKEYYVCDLCDSECEQGTTKSYVKLTPNKLFWFRIGSAEADLCEHCRLMLEEVLRSIVGVNEHRESA